MSSPKLPSQSKFLNCFQLEKSYRQSRQCLDVYNYLTKHRKRWNIINNFDTKRCPHGYPPLWIHCSKDGITELSALQMVKEELDKEELGKLGATVLGYSGDQNDFPHWSFGGLNNEYYGYEADVRIKYCLIVKVFKLRL